MTTPGTDGDRSRRVIPSKQSKSIEVSSLLDPTLTSINPSTFLFFEWKTSLIVAVSSNFVKAALKT